ncbi:type IX secretion system membrane protein PorP/SprF [Algoriphagus kandeliae]|uniref:Type IX secretion system membrane protein PorP/SprF n=1 Tax=Algoriphagus kandeliae TaxID=2562278 RepID=A0A4Y9QMG9_9BACT|nr:type IX secretion system membrane protein PorP/SprF [Algoriphagus kandeliae]TFV93028.1 type IX secretion system membrane protein PorP/SprF [Algoriphagus kandeliae]
MKGKVLFLLFLISYAFSSKGQDVQYSQFYANPLYLSPAFAGSTDQTRVGFNFRNQWPALEQSFVAFTAYGDHFFENFNSGLGLIISGARESFTQSQQMDIGLVYSYRLRLSEDNFLQFGMQGSYSARDALFDDIILGTQLDINRGVILGSPGDGFEGDSKLSAFDANAGILLYGNSYWFGFSAFHLLEPPISYLDIESNSLPVRYNLHGGYRISLPPGNINDYYNNTDQERSLALAFNYKRQGLFSQLDLGAEFYFEPLILGVWYRGLPTKYQLPNNESLIALVGLSLDSGLEIGYSFDFSISILGQSVSGGAHELSVRYLIPVNPKKRRFFNSPGFKF